MQIVKICKSKKYLGFLHFRHMENDQTLKGW